MAENQNVEQDEAAEGEAQASGKPSAKKKIIMIIVGIIALIALSIGGTIVAMKFLAADEPIKVTDEGSEMSAEGATDEVSEEDFSPAIYYPLKPVFIANYNVRGRQRFLQIEITLMLRDNTVVPTLDLHVPAIKNSIIMLLRGQSYEELQTPEGKELLRQQTLLTVQDVIAKEIGKPGIEQVLFTNLVMQ